MEFKNSIIHLEFNTYTAFFNKPFKISCLQRVYCSADERAIVDGSHVAYLGFVYLHILFKVSRLRLLISRDND